MTHLEDAVIYGGVNGTRQAINALRELRDMLAGSSSRAYDITLKWDGAPAIFFGIVPDGYEGAGSFFVSKKGLFNKTPKYYTSDQQINEDTSGDLAQKLKVALSELPKVYPDTKDIFQGDMMFTSSDLSTETIDEESYVTFHPNTIVYAMPESSEEGDRVRSAKMGIAVHTRYRGTHFTDMNVTYDVKEEEFNAHQDVWLRDSQLQNVSGSYTLTKKETDEVTSAISSAGKIFQVIASSTIQSIENDDELARAIETFNNVYVRANEPIKNTEQHVDNLIQHITDKFEKEAQKRKTDKGRQSQYDRRDKFLEFFSDSNKKNLRLMFDLQNAIIIGKLLIMDKLNRLNSSSTFVKTADGYKVTGHEGYVVIDRLSNGAYKLVDRMTFSYHNFSPEIIKGWNNV